MAAPQRTRLSVRATKVGLPLLAHALLLAAVVVELLRPCGAGDDVWQAVWRERFVSAGGIVAGVALLANLVLYFPRDRYSIAGKRVSLALLATGGVVLLVNSGHCALPL